MSSVELSIGSFAQGALSFMTLIQCGFYFMQFKRNRCFGEVVYLAAIQCLSYGLSAIVPAGAAGKVIALENGDMVPWMRYAAWLLTCPTLLTLLANVSGDGSFAPRKLLLLLKVDQGMLVCGISAAIMTGSWKWIVWSIGAVLGCMMFLMLWFIWQYAVLTLPKRAKPYVNTMFQITFATWPGYPLLFLLGPTGVNVMTDDTSAICHTILDVFAKNLFSIVGWYMRWCVLRDYNSGSLEILYDDDDNVPGAKAKNSEAVPENYPDSDEGSDMDTIGSPRWGRRNGAPLPGRQRGMRLEESVSVTGSSREGLMRHDVSGREHKYRRESGFKDRRGSRASSRGGKGYSVQPMQGQRDGARAASEMGLPSLRGNGRAASTRANSAGVHLPLLNNLGRMLVITEPSRTASRSSQVVVEHVLDVAESNGFEVNVVEDHEDALFDITKAPMSLRPHAVFLICLSSPSQGSLVASTLQRLGYIPSSNLPIAAVHYKSAGEPLEHYLNSIGVESTIALDDTIGGNEDDDDAVDSDEYFKEALLHFRRDARRWMGGVIRLVHASRPGDLAVPYGATHSTNSATRTLAPPGAGSDSGTTDTDRAGDAQGVAGSITFDTDDVGEESTSPLPTAEGAPTVAALGRKHTNSTWDYQMPDKADLKALERSVSQRERPAERVQSTHTSRRGSNDMSRAVSQRARTPRARSERGPAKAEPRARTPSGRRGSIDKIKKVFSFFDGNMEAKRELSGSSLK